MQQTTAGSKDWIHTALEVFKADQLESLISRWIGVAYWPSQQQKSVEAFDRAGSFFFSRPLNDVIRNHQELLLFGLLEVGSNACMLLRPSGRCGVYGDGTTTPYERNQIGTRKLTSFSNTTIAGMKCQDQRASESLKSQAKMARGIQSLQQDNNLILSRDARKSIVKIQRWWSDVKSQPGGLGVLALALTWTCQEGACSHWV